MKAPAISRRTFLVTGTAVAAAPLLKGEVPTGPPAPRDDDTDVREVIASFAAAWSRHDVKGMGVLRG
jgi:hypothetical protein